MKKYSICFLLLAGVIFAGLLLGFIRFQNHQEELPQPTEGTSETVLETETVTQDQIVLNQKQVTPVPLEKKRFLLVSEDGFLLVFGSNRTEICLYTHIPISDFPESEREKLRQGIWFQAMEEIYSYLESYTS